MLTLRPENTAGVVRAYIEHKLWDRGLNSFSTLARSSGASVRRRGDIASSTNRSRDHRAENCRQRIARARCEILELLATLLDRVGITGWTIEPIRRLPSDRAQFNEALRKALEPVVSQMCEDASAALSQIRCASSTARFPKTSRSSTSCRASANFLTRDRTHFEE